MADLQLGAMASIVLTLAVMLWRGGKHSAVLEERVAQLRVEHDELHKYAHGLHHEVLSKISEKLDNLQIQILAITPRDQWPK